MHISINLGIKYLTVHIFSLGGGPIGRHLGFLKFPNDDKMSSVGFFKGKVYPLRISKEKTLYLIARSNWFPAGLQCCILHGLVFVMRMLD